MNNDIVGLRQAFICKKGSFAAPTTVVPMGLGDAGTIEIAEETIKGYLNEDLPDMVKFSLSFKSYQNNIFNIQRAIQVFAADNGVDAQAVTEKTSGSTYGGVYNFSGNNFLGFDFEYRWAMNGRYTVYTCEVSLPVEDAKLIIQSALVNTPVDLTAGGIGLGSRGIEFSSYKSPNFGKVDSPTGTTLINGYEVSDREVILKSVGGKLQYNRTKVNWINAVVNFTIKRTSAQELLNYLIMNRSPELRIEEKFSAVAKETLLFGAGVMYRKHDHKIAKDEGYIKLSYEKNIPVWDFAFDTGNSIISVSMAV